MICATCKEVLSEGARFCSSCGAPQPDRDPRTAETLKQAVTTNDRVTRQTDDQTGPPLDPRIGLTLDSKYQLIECLGEGAMGSVYRARRLHIGDDVAVKLMSPDLIRHQGAIERFRREARAAAMIRHPNIVSIHDFSDADEAYIVMELVNGESLRKILERENRLSVQRAVVLMCDICAGVGAAHRKGLLHRDLKPDNVIVTSPIDGRETAKVVDFGLAKVREAADVSALTQTGALVGTLYYMSPEQCRAESLDARADVYSLGAMLYEMLSGQPPFLADTAVGLITKHLTETPQPFSEHLLIPPALSRVCLRALAKNREERQADAIKFAEELQAATSNTANADFVTPHLSVTLNQKSHTPWGWIAAGFGVFVLASVLIALGVAIKLGVFGLTHTDTTSGNSPVETKTAPAVNRPTATSQSEASTRSATAADLRGTWKGSYGPLNEPATLVIKTHKGDFVEGVLEQSSTQVAFSGTVSSGVVHLKQTSVLKGEGWSLGEDTGTLSDDGKKMSGTGKDATGGPLGLTYNWSFQRN
ncbi:MAG: hypothetical protein C5B55_06275 [Blastocatellia bacterium]|nr:MAG: hypothetical protein C5B55_06275 [Blastocatellia bacterium]